MAEVPPLCDFGWKPSDFSLPATDGKTYSLNDVKGPNGTLVGFICNHCPYVTAIISRLVRDAKSLQDLGIGVAAISSNDQISYPEDSFEKMATFAQTHGFSFPYLWDESQMTARSWGAICTPDFFGFNADTALQYRGRLDASRKTVGDPDLRRDLVEAMTTISQSGTGPTDQYPSMGCSIKWKAN